MATLRSITLRYPGSYGLNTQEDTQVDPASRFAATVTNGVINKTGKLVSREDFALQTSGFSNTVQSLFNWYQSSSSNVIVSAAAGKVYTGTTTLTERVDYSSSSTTLCSLSFAVLGDYLAFGQKGINSHIVDSGWSSATFSGASFTDANIFMSGFGRMWAANDSSNTQTIWWSDLLDPLAWASGDAGSINVRNAWPNGPEDITAMTTFGNRIIVFGTNSILLYTMADDLDPSAITLAPNDTVHNLACIARDSVQVTDQGVFFLTANGIFKIDRLGQTTQLLTNKHVSLLCNDQVLASISTQSDKTLIKSAYYPIEGWYVLSFPTENKSYCVHTRKAVPDVEGSHVITTWTNTGRPFHAFAVDGNNNFYSGGVNGVHKYTGYTPDGASNAYSLIWSPQWQTFEDDSRLKHLKKLVLALTADLSQAFTVAWSVDYKTGTSRSETGVCGAEQFAEDPGLGYAAVPLGGSCKVVKPTVTFVINGAAVTLHHAQIYANPGKTSPM